ncbi:putative serine/arginine-rich splicing factor SR45 isoform X1 [Iris pallida]|uniref:Serine/arginine-rich splicing factor SR45 isoform X1 n=1 Tax=Iris pallida TaxID=29817 RepID=A0AAX6GZ38_IRIPA|nr:putative serine/arginine-rich splicing factor SR45 isoform X1 [Iris pallida]KAJ6834019.1 putative serine/arginine-rich splicing factor SR45 isoform X1 [Iris pallida]
MGKDTDTGHMGCVLVVDDDVCGNWWMLSKSSTTLTRCSWRGFVHQHRLAAGCLQARVCTR